VTLLGPILPVRTDLLPEQSDLDGDRGRFAFRCQLVEVLAEGSLELLCSVGDSLPVDLWLPNFRSRACSAVSLSAGVLKTVTSTRLGWKCGRLVEQSVHAAANLRNGCRAELRQSCQANRIL
jgi:hypothetical protein